MPIYLCRANHSPNIKTITNKKSASTQTILILLGIVHRPALTSILKLKLVYYVKEIPIYLTYRQVNALDVAQIMCIVHLSISV